MRNSDRPSILFLNVGWMNDYKGPAANDPTKGNFGWLKADKTRLHGHECYNFANQNGRCWGSHPTGGGTNIDKVGGQPGAESVNNVLVIWFSRDPRINKAVIV